MPKIKKKTKSRHVLKFSFTETLSLELFQNGSVHEFYRLKALITLEQVNTSVVEKNKKKILN